MMNGPALSTVPIRVRVGDVRDSESREVVSLSFTGRVLARMTTGTDATFAERVSLEVALSLKPMVARMFEDGVTTVAKLRADTTELRHRVLADIQQRSTTSGVVVIAIDRLTVEGPSEGRIPVQERDRRDVPSIPPIAPPPKPRAPEAAKEAPRDAHVGESEPVPPPSAISETTALFIGKRVHAQWTNGSYYPARIVKEQDGLYEVDWHDGSDPTWIRADQIRGEPIPSAATGPIVSAQWSSGEYYRARVIAERDGLYEVAWEDGSAPSWLRRDQIRGDVPK